MAIGTAQGTRERVRKIIKEVPPDGRKIIVSVYGNSMIETMLRESLSVHCSCPIEEMRLGPVLGIHLGDSAIGVSWIEKKIRMIYYYILRSNYKCSFLLV